MPDDFKNIDWDTLLTRISEGKCTPFLGPEVFSELQPFNCRIANDWSRHPKYPFTDCNNLTLAAQFLSVQIDPPTPKSDIVRRLSALTRPDFSDPQEPHRVLASLPLPLYITTNYDDFMVRALFDQRKEPIRERCRWDDPSQITEVVLPKPTCATPIVFHLFGYCDEASSDSLVLTEDDYLEFLANVSKYQLLIPPQIQKAFAGTSILLLGYRFDDWNFRILFRTIIDYLRRNKHQAANISVQLLPPGLGSSADQIIKAEEYFRKYLEGNKIVSVCWGTCQDFITELKQRWENSGHARR